MSTLPASQLLVHEDVDMAEQVHASIKRALGAPSDVFQVRNFADALDRIRHPALRWSLIVVSAAAPQSSSARSSGDSIAAQDFIGAARELQPDVPIVALTPRDDLELRGLLKAWRDTALIKYSPDFQRELEDIARDFHNKRPVRPTLLQLEITLMDVDSGYWRVRRKGRIQNDEIGTFLINPKIFRDLVELSDYIPKAGPTWHDGPGQRARRPAHLRRRR
jgi:hypothetical protein